MRWLFALLIFAFPAQAQTPQIMNLTSPLLITDIPIGGVVDYSGYVITATASMSQVVKISSSNTRTSAPNNAFCVIKLGWVNANNLAQSGVEISDTWDCRIEIAAVTNALGTGVWLNGGNSNVANNFLDIGAITGSGGNGLLLETLSNDMTWNVQGNHIRVGQVIGNGASGVVAWIGAIGNRLEVGPVEHNTVFGCYDNAGGTGWAVNVWTANGTNSNGVTGGPC